MLFYAHSTELTSYSFVGYNIKKHPHNLLNDVPLSLLIMGVFFIKVGVVSKIP